MFTAKNVISYNDNKMNCSFNDTFQMISQNVFGVVPIPNIYNQSLGENLFTIVFDQQKVKTFLVKSEKGKFISF